MYNNMYKTTTIHTQKNKHKQKLEQQTYTGSDPDTVDKLVSDSPVASIVYC